MEQIEQRKEKAAELSSGRHANTDYAPKLTPYERQKQCSLCSVVVCIVSSCQVWGWLVSLTCLQQVYFNNTVSMSFSTMEGFDTKTSSLSNGHQLFPNFSFIDFSPEVILYVCGTHEFDFKKRKKERRRVMLLQNSSGLSPVGLGIV